MRCRAFSPFVFIDYFTNLVYILHTRRVVLAKILKCEQTAKYFAHNYLPYKKRKL